MREIKFRSWDKNYNRFRDIVLSSPISALNNNSIDERFIFLQYTGLKDINGVDVYEGDILKLEITEELKNSSFTNSNIGKKAMKNNVNEIFIEFIPSKFLEIKFDVYMKNNEGVNRVGGDTGHRFPMYMIEKGGIIVGNIYENKDLLEVN